MEWHKRLLCFYTTTRLWPPSCGDRSSSLRRPCFKDSFIHGSTQVSTTQPAPCPPIHHCWLPSQQSILPIPSLLPLRLIYAHLESIVERECKIPKITSRRTHVVKEFFAMFCSTNRVVRNDDSTRSQCRLDQFQGWKQHRAPDCHYQHKPRLFQGPISLTIQQ